MNIRHVWAPLLAALLSLAAFLPGITWGLPSRDVDRFLFGDRTPWTGEEIVALLDGGFDAGDGSADADTIEASENAIVNDTDRERAEIVARYRLYSYQPDEMLTFRALATAAANRGDPQFYTYGGLWVYPVGVLVKACQIVGLIEPGGGGGQAFYLDHPEEFAKFYVVARLYAVAWAALGAAVVCVLVRRVTRSDLLGIAAAVTYALLPVVVVGAHEAKPHLPGAVLALWAVLPAERFVRTGRRSSLLWSGVLCGLATGMVMTMAVSFLVPPTAALLRRRRDRAKSGVAAELAPRSERRPAPDTRSKLRGYLWIPAIVVGIVAFALTNPYLVLNLLTNPSAVAGNAGQTAGHYSISLAGAPSGYAWFTRATAYLADPAILFPGFAILVGLGLLKPRLLRVASLAGPPAILISVAFLVTSIGRPPDHVRFASLGAISLITLLFIMLGQPTRRWAWIEPLLKGQLLKAVLVTAPVVLVSCLGMLAITSYIDDAGQLDSRELAAEVLAHQPRGPLTLWAAPAPAFVPAFDLRRFEARVVAPEDADVRMTPESEASISWAHRRFVLRRSDAVETVR